MTDYNKEIKQALQDLKYYRILNAYHDHVFNLKQESQRKFLMFSFVVIFINIFLGFFSNLFILFAFGMQLTVLIYLIFDRIFLSQWKEVLKILIKNTKNEK